MADKSNQVKGGLFIVLEGIDGTGKSTQCRLLYEKLLSLDYTVHLDKEPSDKKYGAIVRESAETGRLSPDQELEYFHLDRKMHVEELITPAKQAGEIVILDRYYFSTIAYQGQRGFDPEELLRENESFAPAPDLLIILDLSVETSLERIGTRGDTANEFEQKDALQYCRDTYLSFADRAYAKVISSDQQISLIHDQITACVLEKLKSQD